MFREERGSQLAMSDTEATQTNSRKNKPEKGTQSHRHGNQENLKDKDRLNDARTMKEAGQRQVKQMELSG